MLIILFFFFLSWFYIFKGTLILSLKTENAVSFTKPVKCSMQPLTQQQGADQIEVDFRTADLLKYWQKHFFLLVFLIFPSGLKCPLVLMMENLESAG